MPFCRECGGQLPEGATYCPNCGAAVRAQAVLADWGDRFVAWLIDFIIVEAFIFIPETLLKWITWPIYMWLPPLPRWMPFAGLGLRDVTFFLYWMLMEGIYGQSIGKMVMKAKVTRLDGSPVDLGQAAIESLGKAFVLPIDVLVGLIFFQEKRQRLFSYISNTIVVKTPTR